VCILDFENSFWRLKIMNKTEQTIAIGASGTATLMFTAVAAAAVAGTGLAGYALAVDPALIAAAPLKLLEPVGGLAAAALFGAGAKNAAFDTRDAWQGKPLVRRM